MTKRLNLDDPMVWDKWRELYYSLTPEENIEFGNDIEARYPGQQSYNVANFDYLFGEVCRAPAVIEIGGWKGELALHCMSKHVIKSWFNIDMCKAAVEKTVPMGSLPYAARFPYEFDWFAREERKQDYDVCVSAHTIEHLSDRHLIQLIDYIRGIGLIMFEAPISPKGDNWDGYHGTHMLTMGWNGVNASMEGRGYRVHQINGQCYLYERKS